MVTSYREIFGNVEPDFAFFVFSCTSTIDCRDCLATFGYIDPETHSRHSGIGNRADFPRRARW